MNDEKKSVILTHELRVYGGLAHQEIRPSPIHLQTRREGEAPAEPRLLNPTHSFCHYRIPC